jgi:hypothetical protein
MLERFLEVDPQLYDSIAHHTLSNFKGYCKICLDARCRIQQRREFEPSQYLSWHTSINWKVEAIYATTTRTNFNRLFAEFFRLCFDRLWIQKTEIQHCFTGADIYSAQSAVSRAFACQNKNYAPLVASFVSDLKALQNGLNVRDAIQRKNDQAENATQAKAYKVALALFHEEDPLVNEKEHFVQRLLTIFQEVVTVRKHRFFSQKDEADIPKYRYAKDTISLNEALATLGSTLVADHLEGGPKVSDSPAVYIIVEGLADFLTDQIIEVDALCSGRELSINLQCQTNNESTLVPGNLTRVKQRGAAAGYGNSEEVTGVRPCEGFLICSLLKSERRFEDGVLV